MPAFELVLTAALIVAHAAGVVFALRAAAAAHTAQGGVAWAMSLVLLPWITLPLYVLFGPPRLDRRASDQRMARAEALARARVETLPRAAEPDEQGRRRRGLLERLAPTPVLDGEPIDLLIDGGPTFDAIFEALDAAREYALIQFYILRNDELGRAFKAKLIERARAGVAVRLLYDGVGARNVGRRYLAELAEGGVDVRAFAIGRRIPKPMQLNFRNHRKIVAVDGQVAIMSGANVADEYLGRDPAFGPWRDTTIRLKGPAAAAVEASFLEDWIWTGGDAFELAPPAPGSGGVPTLILPTGPADPQPSCALFFCHLIGEANARVWIASPYFVPDLDVMTALKLAALRGVDVRVLLPARPDHLVVWLAAFAYVGEAQRAGIRLYAYEAGFMHQKTLLIDDWAAAVGTANLDNRSLRLNFELTGIGFDPGFAADVARMLEADFAQSRVYDREAHRDRGLFIRLLAPAARLFAPLL